MNRNKGFTLIELLVVVAIIGILATVVLANLNSANEKGANAAIKQNLNSVRTQAQLYYTMHNNGYVGAVPATDNICTDPIVIKALTEAYNQAKQTGGLAISGDITTAQTAAATVPLGTANIVCHAPTSGRAYAISAPLRGQEGAGATIKSFFCVDHTGFAGVRVTNLAANAIVCPAT